ncbi:hypothetical protein BKA70DRAFT_581138 [Coprinopsis sp. MPI-PUGE-AT-0042]|nr:hypothetical protein BKA70DRAFT_581138 [Coprinopsis sp. MPI-PUGE-AT-0042]
MAPRLPTELFREIVGHFSKDSDIGTLQAAALASSELLKPCQEKIFSTITVINLYKGESNDTHHRARLEVFRRNNDLLTFVKEVSVQQSEAWGEWSIAPFDSPILTSMVDLVYLLATPFIEKFSFAGWPQRPAPGPKFQEGIVALLRSPRLTSLELLRVPKEFIGLVESPFLVHLSLQRVEDYYTWPTLMRLFSEPLPPTGTTQQKHPTLPLHHSRQDVDRLPGGHKCYRYGRCRGSSIDIRDLLDILAFPYGTLAVPP